MIFVHDTLVIDVQHINLRLRNITFMQVHKKNTICVCGTSMTVFGVKKFHMSTSINLPFSDLIHTEEIQNFKKEVSSAIKQLLANKIMETSPYLDDCRRTSGGTCCKNGMIGLRKNLYLSCPDTCTWGCSLVGT